MNREATSTCVLRQAAFRLPIADTLGPLLLTLNNLNPGMDK